MSRVLHTAKLGEIAELNPRLAGALESHAFVSFLPMSALSAETASTAAGEDRRYSEVSKGYTPFLNGDLLVAKITPCFENGKIVQAMLDHPVGFGSTEFHVVRPHAGKADGRYLLHFLRQERIRRAGEGKMTGSAGQRRVPEHFLAGLEIVLPPVAEQRRIADVLDRAEALRAKRRSALEQIDTLTQAIFLDLFGDPRHDSQDTSSPLSDCAEVVAGIAKGRKLEGRQKVIAPYLRVANVQEGGDFDKLGRGAMWEGQIDGCIHQNHVFRVRVDASLLVPRFLHEYLQGPAARAYFLRCAKRTTNLASINMTQLRALPVFLPPLALQHDFARRIAAIEKLKAAHRASLAEMDALFASLQHRAFRGELWLRHVGHRERAEGRARAEPSDWPICHINNSPYKGYNIVFTLQ